jgi:Tol biopolymer transport system component
VHFARNPAALVFAALATCCHGADPAGLGAAGARSGGLVFVKQVDGQADLARARVEDGAVLSLCATPEREERWPYWSDVARRLVFQARPYGPALQTDLVFWDPESGEEAILASTPARDERWPTWSPVAPRLAYAYKQPGVPSGIVLYDLVTKRSEVLASVAVPGFFLRPAFSSDGRRLIAQQRAGQSPETHLWILESGRAPRRVTGEPGAIDTKARFTPDGRTVLFSRQMEPGGARDLFRLDLETGVQERFASLPSADDHSAWPSPVRDEIAFVSNRDGARDVFLLDLADGEPRNLTRTPEIDEGVPLWSPDGDRLVILRRPPTEPGWRPSAEETHIAVIDREGHLLFETQGMMADWMPAWPEDADR